MNSWIQSILESPERLAMPIMTHPGIEAIGKHVIDAVTDGEVHYQAIKAVADSYPSAVATVIMDLTVEAEAFGATVRFSQEEIPNVTGRLVSDMKSVQNLQVPPLTAGRIPEYLKANRLSAAHIDKPVLAGAIGPFSLAGRLYDMSEIMIGIYIDPETISLLLRKCTDFITSYCQALKAAGTKGVIIAEPAAGLLSDEECQQYSSLYVKEIVEAVQDDSFAVVLHNCGNRGQCTPAMIETGAAALHFGNAIDLTKVLEICPSDIPVMGNIDPVGILKQADDDAVYRCTAELLRLTSQYPNFVLSSGCDMPSMVPAANITAFFKALDDFNRR